MKKIYFSIAFIIITLLLTTVCSFAATNNKELNDLSHSSKNAIQGAENSIENVAKDAANQTKNATNSLGDAAGKLGSDAKNTVQDLGNGAKNTIQDATKDDYNATRTASESQATYNDTMRSQIWTWVIVGAITVGIIAFFWYFLAKTNNNN